MGHPKVADNVTLNGLLLPIRRAFDQYANIRPAVLYDGVNRRSRLRKGEKIDMVVVRENTEGEYAQVGGFLYHDQPEEVAIQTSVFTRRGCERVIRVAFELARQTQQEEARRIDHQVERAGLQHGAVGPRVRQGGGGVSGISTESLLVDAAAMNFIRRPESFDVVVGSNLFGDILSDLSAIIVGSMGLAPSANIDPSRRFPSMFEPVHGSAPDIAFKGIVNPLATFLCAAQMVEHLEMTEGARRSRRCGEGPGGRPRAHAGL